MPSAKAYEYCRYIAMCFFIHFLTCSLKLSNLLPDPFTHLKKLHHVSLSPSIQEFNCETFHYKKCGILDALMTEYINCNCIASFSMWNCISVVKIAIISVLNKILTCM